MAKGESSSWQVCQTLCWGLWVTLKQGPHQSGPAPSSRGHVATSGDICGCHSWDEWGQGGSCRPTVPRTPQCEQSRAGGTGGAGAPLSKNPLEQSERGGNLQPSGTLTSNSPHIREVSVRSDPCFWSESGVPPGPTAVPPHGLTQVCTDHYFPCTSSSGTHA